MSDTYTKLFRSLAASTIVSEPLATRWLWVTLLSQADARGCVWGSIPGLARLANISIAECEAGLACFLSPDPYSRTREHEGRRIEEIDGGWRLLNHSKYSAIRSGAERAEYKRQWDRENRPSGHRRAKGAEPEQSDSPTVRQKSDRGDDSDRGDPTNTNTNTTSEKQKQEQGALSLASPSPSAPAAPKSRGSRLPDSWVPDPDLAAWTVAEFPQVDARAELAKFRDYWHGTAGAKGRKADWPATWRNWIRRAAETVPAYRHGARAGPGAAVPASKTGAAVLNLGKIAHDPDQARTRIEHEPAGLAGDGNRPRLPATAGARP